MTNQHFSVSVILLGFVLSVQVLYAAAFLPLEHSSRSSIMTKTSSSSKRRQLILATSNKDSQAISSEDSSAATIDQSTLTLLEHININVPSHEYILDFYWQVLGCGMDPRKAENLRPDAPKKTLWANCGASQFHLPYGDVGQAVRGQIGLRFADLGLVRQQLDAHRSCYQSYEVIETAPDGKTPTCLLIIDKYGNQLYCRPNKPLISNKPRLAENWRQPFISSTDTETWGDDVASRFGKETTNCQGIDYVEFLVPPGTAETIALFYEKVLEATTSVLEVPSTTNRADNAASPGTTKLAIVALGNISPQGQADQSLIFRETPRERIPAYDGHHIALYVGQSAEDFEYAFENCKTAGVVWVNPRFSDKVMDLEGARQEKQFRFKDIVDLKTGKVVYELEHEVRSVQHNAFPGEL